MLPAEKDPIAPGDVAKPNKVEPAKKTWFFQRTNGSIIGCQAIEAWQILLKQNVYLRDFRLIGCSDGSTFQRAINEAHKVFRETKDIEKSQEIIRQGELDEIEKARGNMELPPNPTAVTTKKSP